jgi:superoxide reductase
MVGNVLKVQASNRRKENIMAVKAIGENYKCEICGNEVTITKVGGGTLVCCGQSMKKI